MNYDTHWGSARELIESLVEFSAVSKTSIKGFVKSLELTEYRYNGVACTGAPFLVITTSSVCVTSLRTRYALSVQKGQKDTSELWDG